jgi:PDZ domain-containing protein
MDATDLKPPHSNRGLKTIIALAVVMLLLVAGTMVWALTAQSKDFAFVPRAAQAALPVVTLEGQKPPPDDAGAVYFSTVGVRHATIFETWFGVGDGGELVPEHAIISPGETEQDRKRLEMVSMSSSQQSAEIVALRALGYDVQVKAAGVRIVGIGMDAPIGQNGAKIGDIIVSVNTTPIRTTQALRDALQAVGPERPVRVRLHRGGDFEDVTTTTTKGPDGQALLGIVPSQANRIDTPRAVTYKVEGVGGPSAGLSFALQIYSAGRDYADLGGLTVAATGSLNEKGEVGSVGGAAQKAIGAGRVGAALVLVPQDNFAEAAKAAPAGLRVVAVASFDEALAAIQTAATA